MTWTVHDREFAAVRKISNEQRYEYTVKRAAWYRELWSLRQPGGWVLSATSAGVEIHPVWPHRRFAEVMAIGSDWAGAEPSPICIDEWLGPWTRGMIDAGRSVLVFPVDIVEIGGVIDPQSFADDLRSELALVE